MITKEECINYILQGIPAFQPQWQKYLTYWGGQTAGLCNDMAEFSRYVYELVAAGHSKDLQGIFDLIEHLMVEGDIAVKDTVATCFLENLMNKASEDAHLAKRFVPLLGPQSRAYCKAWDEFTGISTEGL